MPGNEELTARLRARNNCPGGPEAHAAHMELNGECPWCVTYDPEQRDTSLDHLTGEQAVAAIVRRHG